MSEHVPHRPNVLLFGDSLTERGYGPGGWVAGLAHHFTRKADILNRGFSGYNTRWALRILPDVLADVPKTNTLFAVLFFGANDAAIPEGLPIRQHVPVEEYQENLKALVAGLKAHGIVNILIITPPPLNDDRWHQRYLEFVSERLGNDKLEGLGPSRLCDHTQKYAAACAQVAKDLSLPVVDLFNALQQEQDWKSWLFDDGLHFSPAGNQAVLKHVIAALESNFPQYKPDSLPFHFPSWEVVDWQNPEKSFGR